MTKPPCYNGGKDCPRRVVGCRAVCEEWQAWLVIHAREAAAVREKRRVETDADGFMAGQWLRTHRHNRNRWETERRRRSGRIEKKE